ncbi:hypothetical protein [Brevundimonas sp.]|uniref:hypothetical protein n=1 Tax=Brevundimonas sp. TaxID=1871086 RepID=UPI0025E8B602|nr:hypothetical protein [Brevundimonas sp.]
MYAQRQTRSHAAPRGRYNPRTPRPPARARLGLALRRSMNFGPLGDIEPLMQGEGLALAPMSTGEASLNIGGISVLPTAAPDDLGSGKLQGLVVPGGAYDVEGQRQLQDLLNRAKASGLPVLAFGEGVERTAEAFGCEPGEFSEAPAVLAKDGRVTALDDRDQVRAAAAKVG